MIQRGLTLIETVVVVGISAVVLMALIQLYLTFNSMYGVQQAAMATGGSASASMNAFEAAILPANQVLSSHAFFGRTYTSSSTALVLELPSIDSSGAIVAGLKDYIVFFSSSSTLYRLTSPSANSARISGTTTLSTTLQSISFTYNSATFTSVSNVIVDIQTRASYKEQAVQSHLTEKLYLRNYTL
jgi:prepilin-type N-terminal cleavage/methylation domain-containing protein